MKNKSTTLKIFVWITPILLVSAFIISILGFGGSWTSRYNGMKIQSVKPILSSVGGMSFSIIGFIIYLFIFLKSVQNLEKFFLWMLVISFSLSVISLGLAGYGKASHPDFKIYLTDTSYFHSKMTGFYSIDKMVSEINKTPNHRVPGAIIANLIDAGILSK